MGGFEPSGNAEASSSPSSAETMTTLPSDARPYTVPSSMASPSVKAYCPHRHRQTRVVRDLLQKSEDSLFTTQAGDS